MPSRRVLSSFLWPALILICLANVSIVQAQGAKQRVPENPVADPDADHVKERNEWFFRGRVIRGKPSAEFRRRAYQAKLQLRTQRAVALAAIHSEQHQSHVCQFVSRDGNSQHQWDQFRFRKLLAICDRNEWLGGAHIGGPFNVGDYSISGTQTNINIMTHDTSGAPSHSFSAVLTVAQDFRLTSSTPSQTVTAGQTSGAYNLTVQPVGASFTGAVTLACSAGMPAGAQCMFNPPTAVTPGNSAVDLVMNISTAASKTGLQPLSTHASMFYALWLILPGAVIALSSGGRRAGRRRLRILGSIATLLFSGILLSCGGVSTGGSGLPKGNQPVTYQITVTGTSAGTAVDAGQSVRVTLVVD